MPDIQYRDFQSIEPIDGDDYMVEGYATTFGTRYELYDGVYEVIDFGALDNADMSDVIFQANHTGLPLARTRNNTLSLECDSKGLHIMSRLDGSLRARDVHEAIKNGLIDRMSWGFIVDEDGYEYDRAEKTMHIVRVKRVLDVSAVSFPANEGTEIHARSLMQAIEEQEKALKEGKAKRERIAAFLKLI